MDFEGAMDELAMETGVKKERAVTVRPRKPILKRMMSEAAGAFTDEFISQMYR
jgi:hypothetical protein